jgi:uncharacterized protein
MSDYHEPTNELTDNDRNIVRALSSLKEEIEAVNWYHQRYAACQEPELKKILAHNRDEEIEHAVMTMEWLRRNMSAWDEVLKTYLFTTKSVVEVEEEEQGNSNNENGNQPSSSKSLGIGSLKDTNKDS